MLLCSLYDKRYFWIHCAQTTGFFFEKKSKQVFQSKFFLEICERWVAALKAYKKVSGSADPKELLRQAKDKYINNMEDKEKQAKFRANAQKRDQMRAKWGITK